MGVIISIHQIDVYKFVLIWCPNFSYAPRFKKSSPPTLHQKLELLIYLINKWKDRMNEQM